MWLVAKSSLAKLSSNPVITKVIWLIYFTVSVFYELFIVLPIFHPVFFHVGIVVLSVVSIKISGGFYNFPFELFVE